VLANISKKIKSTRENLSILKDLNNQILESSKLSANKQKQPDCPTCGQSLSSLSDEKVRERERDRDRDRDRDRER